VGYDNLCEGLFLFSLFVVPYTQLGDYTQTKSQSYTNKEEETHPQIHSIVVNVHKKG
jgi:myosin heavy subunit